jgi:hypothetical protein
VIEVADEELCIRELARIPINKPTIGLFVVINKFWAKLFPNSFREAPIRLILIIKIYR